jgi:uncharacterized protein (DUF39 family)
MELIEDNLGWIFGGLIVGAIALVIWAGMQSENKMNRLMAECMADGKKEYQCVAMLKSNTDVVTVPVVIPRGR